MTYTDIPKKIREWFETHNIDKRGNLKHPDGNTYHIFKFENSIRWAPKMPTNNVCIFNCIFEVSMTVDTKNKIFQYVFDNQLDACGKFCKYVICDCTKKLNYEKILKQLEDALDNFNMLYDHYQYLSKTYKSNIKLKQLEADFSE